MKNEFLHIHIGIQVTQIVATFSLIFINLRTIY